MDRRARSAGSTVSPPCRVRAPTRIGGRTLQPDPDPRRRGAPFAGTERHYAIGTLDIDSVSLALAVGHAASPLGGRSAAAARDRQLATLADVRREFSDREVLLMGDFNTSPWSLAFHRLLSQSGLRDAARGFGYRPTWPAQRPWLGIPIDHHVVSDGIVITEFSVVGPTGSDHLAVYSELGFR